KHKTRAPLGIAQPSEDELRSLESEVQHPDSAARRAVNQPVADVGAQNEDRHQNLKAESPAYDAPANGAPVLREQKRRAEDRQYPEQGCEASHLGFAISDFGLGIFGISKCPLLL